MLYECATSIIVVDVCFFQDEKTIEAKARELVKLQEQLEVLHEKSSSDEAELASAQKHYQAVSAGLSKNTDGEDATLADQLMGPCGSLLNTN